MRTFKRNFKKPQLAGKVMIIGKKANGKTVACRVVSGGRTCKLSKIL